MDLAVVGLLHLIARDDDGHVDRGDRHGTGDVGDLVVVVAGAGDDSGLGLHHRGADVLPSGRVGERDGGEGVAVGQAGDVHVIHSRQLVGCAIILMRDGFALNAQRLLEVDVNGVGSALGHLQALLRSGHAVDLGALEGIAVHRGHVEVDGTVQLGIHRFGSLDGIAVHVQVIDGYRRGVVIRIVDVDDVLAGHDRVFHDLGHGMPILGQLFFSRAMRGHVRLVHGGGDGLHRDGAAVNRFGDRRGHGNIRPLDQIVDGIFNVMRLFHIVEDDDIFFFVGRQDEAFLVRHLLIVRQRHGFLSHRVADAIGAGVHHAVVRDGLGGAVQVIVNHVGQGLRLPPGVHRGIHGKRLVEVVQIGVSGLIVPTGEHIALAGNGLGVHLVAIRRRHDLVFGGIVGEGASLRIEGEGAGGHGKITVEHQAGRHLVSAGIGAVVLGVGVPALPGGAFDGGVRHVAGQVAGDVGIQLDLLSADQSAVIVIERQGIAVRVVIEVGRHGAIRRAGGEASRTIRADPAALGVAGVIRIIRIVQVVVVNGDSLEQTIGLAVMGRRLRAVIVLKPIVQDLRLGRGIVPVINRLVARGHDVKTGEFLVVVCRREVPAPIRMGSIECGGPLLADVRAVFGGQLGMALARMPSATVSCIAFTVPGDGIRVAGIPHRHHGGAVGLEGLGGGILEGEVGGIQRRGTGAVGVGGGRRHGHRIAGVAGLGDSRQEGITVVVRVFNHVDDGIIHLRGLPLGVYGGIGLQREGSAGSLGQTFVRIPAVEIVAAAGRVRGQRDLGAIRMGHGVDVIAARGVVGEGEVIAGIVNLQSLAVRVDDSGLGALKFGIAVLLDGRSDQAAHNAVAVHFLDQLVAVAGEVLQHVIDFIFNGIRNELNFLFHRHHVGIGLRLDGRVQISHGDRDAGLLGIVDPLIRVRLHFLTNESGSRSSDGDAVFAQIVLLELLYLGIELVLLTIVSIKVGNTGLEHADVLKLRGGDEALVHDGGRGDFSLAVKPAQEAVAALEGTLRKRAQLVAGGHKAFLGVIDRVAIHEETNDQVVVVASCGRDVLREGALRGHLRLAHEPAHEGGVHLVGGVGQGADGLVLQDGVRREGLAVDHVGHGELFLIFSRDGHVGAGLIPGLNGRTTFIHPADEAITFQLRSLRDVRL